MTANILDAAIGSKQWIKKIDPSATIYSWALNNHWYTNFPLSQEGKIEFRYSVLPYNTGYDAGNSNRFGVEQAQPLIATPVNKDIQDKSLLSLEGSSKVLVSILKTDSTGKNMLIRIRSVSDKDEEVKLNWLSRKPQSVAVSDNSKSGNNDMIVIPAMGFTTIEATFAN